LDARLASIFHVPAASSPYALDVFAVHDYLVVIVIVFALVAVLRLLVFVIDPLIHLGLTSTFNFNATITFNYVTANAVD